MSQWFKHTRNTLLLFCMCLVLSRPGLAGQTALTEDIQKLEADFNSISTEFYQKTSSSTEQYPQPIIDINQLLGAVKKLHDAGRSIAAIQLLYANTQTIIENLDSDAIFSITELLLEKNKWELASTLRQKVENTNDQSILATVQFIFAKYHAQRHEWQQVNEILEGHFAELSDKNTAYAYLLNGTALQHLKLHRKAIQNYDKVPINSLYYSYAQLNTAIANIRQGWWTDAQIKIRDQLKHAGKTNEDEFTNRLYLVLGYALLQREYYRDARDAFRHIGLNNRYTNRALLGIGLTATSQGDYVGALNALTILKDKKTFDLSVEESYLLIPYIYEKLQQEISVTSAYSSAVKYYKNRINELDNLSQQHMDFKQTDYQNKTSQLIIANNSFDYGKHYPASFIKNFQRLLDYQQVNDIPELEKEINTLLGKFDSTYQNIVSDLINKRKNYLASYLNQSRYGLARLYDNSKKADE